MCDILIQPNITPPNFVYKAVLKVSDRIFVGAVLGHPFQIGRRTKAKKLKVKNNWEPLIRFVQPSKRVVKKGYTANSSSFSSVHAGKFTSFMHLEAARDIGLAQNFLDKKTSLYMEKAILKCIPSGKCSRGDYLGEPTCLCEYLTPVEVVE